MDIDIRKATIKDLPVLKAMEQGVISAERPFDPTLAKDPISYYDISSLMANPRAIVLVAVHNEVIVSCGYALEKTAKPYLDHKSYAYLGFMFTLPEYRGQGLNGKILSALKNWANESGLKEIRLTVYNENDAALRAYEKVGFKRHIIEMRWPDDE
ncbi:GNAT family N-acetyltransferase [Maribacter chungangensis]|uniref:GNAT family N-acetyltransferase n=1 Tax=Maribacter chungangensis TaxID=1069117 RepID=A0ABW3B846_9FLAO